MNTASVSMTKVAYIFKLLSLKYNYHKWTTVLLINGVALCLLLGAVEWYLHHTLNHPDQSPSWLLPALRSYYHARDCKILQMNPENAQYDPDLFYTLVPGKFQFKNREFDNTFDVNQLGMRDDDTSLDHPKMIILGDSYAMGWGVDQDETFAQLLESKLGYPVLNAGISSYGTAREVHSLERVNTDSLKYLVIQFCPNDIVENKNYILALHQLQVSSRQLYQQSVESHQKKVKYYLFKHTLNIPTFFKKSSSNVSMNIQNSERLDIIHAEKAFLNIIRDSPKIPPNTKIIVFSLEAEACNNMFISAIDMLLRKEPSSSLSDRMSFIDLTGKIDATHRYVLDPHLNAKGHLVIADQIMNHLDTLQGYNGKKTWFYPSGETSISCEYQNGIKHGLRITYWKNGHISQKTHYQNGVKDGPEMTFDSAGRETSHYIYERGHLISQLNH